VYLACCIIIYRRVILGYPCEPLLNVSDFWLHILQFCVSLITKIITHSKKKKKCLCLQTWIFYCLTWIWIDCSHMVRLLEVGKRTSKV
jgi:ABC-type iron transport system FetAB permease component